MTVVHNPALSERQNHVKYPSIRSFFSRSLVPAADEIHKAVWNRVGLATVQEFVREWASSWVAQVNGTEAARQEKLKLAQETLENWSGPEDAIPGRGCTCCRTTCKRRYGSQNDCYHFHPRIGRGRWSRSGPPWPPCMTCLTSRARRFSRGRCPELAAKYAANWQAHAAHSEPYQAKEKGYSETHHAAAETPKTDATAPIAGGFVASARSQVFHRPDCKSAAKISAKNLVRYASRDEAIQAGKKPCAECRP